MRNDIYFQCKWWIKTFLTLLFQTARKKQFIEFSCDDITLQLFVSQFLQNTCLYIILNKDLYVILKMFDHCKVLTICFFMWAWISNRMLQNSLECIVYPYPRYFLVVHKHSKLYSMGNYIAAYRRPDMKTLVSEAGVRAWISYWIPQNTLECNCTSMP